MPERNRQENIKWKRWPMPLLKRLREARNLSKLQLAEHIGVGVDCIDNWEQKEKTLSLRDLSSIAYRFGLSSEHLFDKIHKKSSTKLTTSNYYIMTSRDDEDGWWGHVGVRLKGENRSKWFPITLQTAHSASASIQNIGTREEWIVVETLNNRILALRPTAVNRLWILDDAQDQPGDDWDIPIDGYAGQPGEFYKALEEYYEHQFSDTEDELVSPLVREAVEEFTDGHDLDDEQVAELVIKTRIHSLDGTHFSHALDGRKLADIIFSLETKPPALFDFSNDNFNLYIPAENVCLIDMPRRLVEAALRERDSNED